MPEALSTGPAPYRHDFPRTGITTGWAWPPKDYDRWAALIEAWARHIGRALRHGRASHLAVGSLERAGRTLLARHASKNSAGCTTSPTRRSVGRFPEARVGGPHTCGPLSPAAARIPARHSSPTARAAPTTPPAGPAPGSTSSPSTPRASRRVVDGHVRMGLARQLGDIATGLDIVREFPEFAGVPVILGESDPEGCAACSAAPTRRMPIATGRSTALPSWRRRRAPRSSPARAGVTIEGAVTWAFEFEGEPFFAGYRELATNGIAKPVLNAFRMLGMLSGERLVAASSGAPAARSGVLADGVSGPPDVGVIATRDGDAIARARLELPRRRCPR